MISLPIKKQIAALSTQTAPRPQHRPGIIGKTAEPDERPLVKGPSVDPRSATKPTSARFKDRQKPKPLHEASKPAIGRQKKAVLASVVVILCLALAGYFYGISQNMLASKPVIPDTDIDGRDTADVVQSAHSGAESGGRRSRTIRSIPSQNSCRKPGPVARPNHRKTVGNWGTARLLPGRNRYGNPRHRR